MRLAYADPPYPGKANRYPEVTEVDHRALIERLESEYDGWALSTDELNLSDVLALCPPRTRVLAWCRPNGVPFPPYPYAAWEPVLLRPGRIKQECVPSYFIGSVQSGFCNPDALIGHKSPEFCEWVIRCLGADPGEDTLDDVFPGSGVMDRTWEKFCTQPPLFRYGGSESWGGKFNRLRRTNEPLPGMESEAPKREWNPYLDKVVDA